MDVPTWHPANVDTQAPHAAVLGITTGSKPVGTKTEFKLMPGSDIDTSTEAGRELFYDVQDSVSLDAGASHSAVDGRGFFDASDRLFLLEQKRAEQEQAARIKTEQERVLRDYRSKALQAQSKRHLISCIVSLKDEKNTKVGAEPTQEMQIKHIGDFGIGAEIQVRPKRRRTDDLLRSPCRPTRKQTFSKFEPERGDSLRGGSSSSNIDKVVNGLVSPNANEQTSIVDYALSSDGE